MKLICRFLPPLLAALACCPGAGAQAPDGPEVRLYQQMAESHAVIYSGREAEHYDFPYNGHPYWNTPEFRPGDIDFEGRHYYDVPLNIDAHTQRALLRFNNSAFTFALTPGAVSAVDIDGHHFVGVGPDVEGIQEGFYDVIGTGPAQVYKQVNKPLLSASNTNVNGDDIGYEDPNYRPQVKLFFAYKVLYFFRDADGNFSRIRNRNALIKKFPSRKKEIRRAVGDAGLDLPKSNFDAFCEVVLNTAAR
ncbi:MAG: hypothetical protein IKX28_07545 [Bacteroidales bacterium]|nr:hypothetical protein [Bacteroidales bacterium]